jgi:hypothetical protein
MDVLGVCNTGILSIIAMAKRRVLSGVLMMVLVFTIPPVWLNSNKGT